MKPGIEFRYFPAAFRKQAWVIALVVILAVGGAVHQFTSRPPQYRAEASMLVTPRAIVPTFEDTGLSAIQSAYRESVLNDIVQLLRSRRILQRVADQVGFLSAEEVGRRVTVQRIRGTDFLIISAVHELPEQAALIANVTEQELVDFYAQVYRTQAANARKFIEEQLALAEGRLGGAEQALAEFRTRTGVVAPEEVSRTEQWILDLQAQYEAAKLDETTAQTRVAAIRSHLNSQNDEQLASISIGTNPVIAQIRDHLTGLELQLADLRQVYTDQYPKVQAVLGSIAADRERLGAEAAKVLNGKSPESLGISPTREQFVRQMIGGEVDVTVVRAKAAGISAILSRLQARLANIPANELALVRLQRDVRVAEQLVTRLSSLHQDALIRESQAAAAGQAAILIVDQAMTPAMPVPSRLPEAATLAGLLGLLVGAALALAVEGLGERIRHRAKRAFGVPVLAAIRLMNVRSDRSLMITRGVASILLLVLLALMVGAAARLYVAQAGAASDDVAPWSQALRHVLHTSQSTDGAQAGAIPAVAHFSQGLMQDVAAHVAQAAGAVPADVVRFSQMLMQYMAQVGVVPANVTHLNRALMQALHPDQ